MFPFFYVFGRPISMYAIMALIGIFVAGILFCINIKRRGQDENDAIIFLAISACGVLIGGHTLYAITNIPNFGILLEAKGIREIINALITLFGGSVFYGGLIGAIIAGFIVIRAKRLPLDLYLDNSGILAPLFHAFARVGCFLAGCCYGIECDFGFAAHGNIYTGIGDATRFPVQLLEAIINLIIAALIFALYEKKIFKGKLFYLYLSLYAIVRFFDEFLRGDAIRGFVFGLSTSQFISIFIEAFALFMLIVYPKIIQKRHSAEV